MYETLPSGNTIYDFFERLAWITTKYVKSISTTTLLSILVV